MMEGREARLVLGMVEVTAAAADGWRGEFGVRSSW